MPTRSKAFATAIFLLALLAAGIAGYLTWTTASATAVVGCTGQAGVDCDSVLSSQWAKWLGVPVSLFGGVTYLLIALASWPAALRRPSWAPTLLFALSLIAAGSGLWFIGLQVLVVKSFCIYCLAVHSCGLVIVVLSLLLVVGTQEERELGYWMTSDGEFLAEGLDIVRIFLTACGLAATGLATLMLGQVLAPPPALTLETNVEFAELDEPENVAEPEDTPVPEKQPTEPPQEAPLESPDASGEEAEPEIVPDVVVTDDEPDTFESSGFVAEEEDDDLFAEFTNGKLDGADESDEPGVEPESEASYDSKFSRPGQAKRLMKFRGLQALLDVRDMPVVGDAEGKYMVVEMLDYTCKHCRHLHEYVHASLERYNNLGYVIYHTPLNKACNSHVTKVSDKTKHACDYAQLAIGVWLLEPEKFAEFHEYLMTGEKPPTIIEARRRASELVGDELFLDESLQEEVARRLRRQGNGLFAIKTGLPVIMLDRGFIRGTPQTKEQWFGFLEQNVGVGVKRE